MAGDMELDDLQGPFQPKAIVSVHDYIKVLGVRLYFSVSNSASRNLGAVLCFLWHAYSKYSIPGAVFLMALCTLILTLMAAWG